MPASHWMSKTGGHRFAAREWWSNIWYWNSIKGPLSRNTYKKIKLSFRFYNKFSLFIPFCHRVWYNTYETRISIIELLNFIISSLHSPQVRFLDFKINIVLYFTTSPIYRIGRFRCIWILWKLEELNRCRLLMTVLISK